MPVHFYEHVWSILERTPGGIKLCGILLPQVELSSVREREDRLIYGFFLATNIIGYDRL